MPIAYELYHYPNYPDLTDDSEHTSPEDHILPTTFLFHQLSLISHHTEYLFYQPSSIVSLGSLIPTPGMVCMQTDPQNKVHVYALLFPILSIYLFRPHINRVPWLILTIPKVHIIMMVTQSKKILSTYFFIKCNQLIGSHFSAFHNGIISLKPNSEG